MAWWNDIASVDPDWMMVPTRYKPDHIMVPWAPADSTVALQPPIETRWVPQVMPPPETREEWRQHFFAMLRDFADGVSESVLYAAADKADMAGPGDPRAFLRALADQEEGK